MSEPRQLTCHRCRSAELILRETRYDHAEYDGGLYLNDAGSIMFAGEGIFTPGDILPALSAIECAGCGHTWHPRRHVAGSQP
jgi:hypothetical protein